MLNPGAFVEWSRHNYTVTMAVGVRRYIDTDRRSISLARLPYELIEYSRVLTRKAHRHLYRGALPFLADHTRFPGRLKRD